MTTQKKKTSKKAVVKLTRGDVIKMAAAAVGSIVAAPLLTTGPLSPFGQLKQGQLEGEEFAGHGARTGQHHWGMVINLDQCIGCEYCQRACSATNDVKDGEPWNIVVPEKTSGEHTFFLTRPCLHCQNAPCVEVCPVKATYHREDGLVVMDYDRCIGCRYCQIACPYDARRFNWDAREENDNPYVPAWGTPEVERRPRGVVEKCTFCVHRIDAGGSPACVAACPTAAIACGNLDDPEDPAGRLRTAQGAFRLNESSGAEPSQWYRPPVTALGQRRSGQGAGER